MATIVIVCSLLTYWVLNIVSINFEPGEIAKKSIDINEKDYNNLITPSVHYNTLAHPEGIGRTNPFDNYK